MAQEPCVLLLTGPAVWVGGGGLPMPSNNSGTWKTILALKGHLPDVPHLNAGLGTIYSWKALQDHPEFYSRNDLQSPSVTRGPVPTIPAWKTVIWQFGLHQQLVFISVILTNKSSHLRWLKNIRWSPKKQVLSCGQLKSSWIWPRKKAEGSLVKRASTFQLVWMWKSKLDLLYVIGGWILCSISRIYN